MAKVKRNTTVKKRTPFLPPAFHDFMKRRLIDAVGLGLIALALALLIALFSYNHADPSFNVTGSAQSHAANLMGLVGSYSADIFIQTLGLASGLLCVAVAVWGIFVIMRRHLGHWWSRVPLLFLSMIGMAVVLGFIPFISAWSTPYATLGGSLGTTLAKWIGLKLTASLGGSTPWLSGLLLGLVSLSLFASVLGIYWHEWVDAAYRIGHVLSSLRRSRTISETEDDEEEEESEDSSIEILAEKPPRRKATKVEPAKTAKAALQRAALRKPAAKKAASREPDFLDPDNYVLPPLSLLQAVPADAHGPALNEAAYQANAEMLTNVLNDFGVRGEIVRISPGPVVTLYELEPAPGTKTSRVISLADDIARSMSAVSVRVAVVPGRNVIGIELPNARRETVYLRELLETEAYERGGAKIALMLGKEIGGQPIIADLARMPHLLVAGTTGSGKSVAVNTMILSLLYRLPPEKCRFIMIDPKMLELSVYDGIPHLLTPVVTEPKKAVVALKWTVKEMEDRYRAMSKLGVRNIEGYNARLKEAKESGETLTRKVQTGFDPDTGKPIFEEQAIDLAELPYIVVVVDEFADLMLVAGKDIEAAIQRLAQMARAAGIHLLMATQRPSVDVITGTIKANFPTRISFQVTSKIDSRTILGESGAEQLLGQGDMLYMAAGGRIIRVHGPFVRDDEVEKVVAFLKQQGDPDYLDAVTEDDDEFGEFGGADDGSFGGGGSSDELYDKAVALIAREGKASTSFVQRHFQIGYNKAARLIERMEKEGVISTANHVGKREVLVGQR